MFVPKACFRCQGDLAFVRDVGDSYYECVQCGAMVYRLGSSPQAHPSEQGARVAVSLDEPSRRRVLRHLAARRGRRARQSDASEAQSA